MMLLEWFLKDHVTLKTAENSALHHKNKLHFKMYFNRKVLFWIVKIFSFLLYFWSNKCSLGEQKIFK